MKERNETYDWLRLFATILVVIGHSMYLNIQTSYGGITYQVPDDVSIAYFSFPFYFCRKIGDWAYEFHMPLFFALSGAVLAFKPIGKFTTFCKKKVRRLLVPYVICGYFFMLPIKLLAGFYTVEGAKNAYRWFLMGIDSGHLWFLLALFWCMIVFVIICKLLERIGLSGNVIILIIAGGIQLINGKITIPYWGVQNGLAHIFWFAIGYAYEDISKKYRGNSRRIAFIFLLVTIIEIIDGRWGVLNPNLKTIFGIIWMYLLSFLCSKFIPKLCKTKIWKLTINNLFYIYLFHDPLEYIIIKIFLDNGYLCYAIGCYIYIFLRTIGVFAVSITLGELLRHLLSGKANKNGYGGKAFLHEKYKSNSKRKGLSHKKVAMANNMFLHTAY